MPYTLSKIADVTNNSPATVKNNVVRLLKVLTTEERDIVLEHMAESRAPRLKNVKIFLKDLPKKKDYTTIEEYLGVDNETLWMACKRFSNKIKTAPDPYVAFKLNEALVKEMAHEVSQRNVKELIARVDQFEPGALLQRLCEVPKDKPEWILKLMCRHGYRVVKIDTWVAADLLLNKLVQQSAVDSAMNVLGTTLNRGKGAFT